MNDRPVMPSTGQAELRQDADRIDTELHRRQGGTDPFASAVRATRMPMIITNPRMPDNPVVFVNDSFCRLSGYDRHEILGRNCRFLQGPETDPQTVSRLRAAVRDPQALEVDIRNHRKNGEAFWNRLLMAPVYDESGALSYYFASQVDVTLERERLSGLESRNAALVAELADRLRAQEESEARLRFATRAGRMGIWELDLRTNDLTTSDTCRENFGRDPAARFTYADLGRALHPDDRERMEGAMAQSVEGAGDYHMEYRLPKRSCGLRTARRCAWLASRSTSPSARRRRRGTARCWNWTCGSARWTIRPPWHSPRPRSSDRRWR